MALGSGKFPHSFGYYSKVRGFGKFPLFVQIFLGSLFWQVSYFVCSFCRYSKAFGFGKLLRSLSKYSEARGFGEFRRSLSNYPKLVRLNNATYKNWGTSHLPQYTANVLLSALL